MRLLAIMFALMFIVTACGKPQYQGPPMRDGKIVINAGEIKENEVRFYGYAIGKKRIDFFVLRVNGRMEAYLDACARCWPQKMGFRVKDGMLHCLACNEFYALDSLKGIGSCYPMPIKGEIIKGEYVIDPEELKAGARYF